MIELVVLLSAFMPSILELIFNPVTPAGDSQSIASGASSPPKVVQVNVAVRTSLYSRIISSGPISMAGTVFVIITHNSKGILLPTVTVALISSALLPTS